MAKHERRNLAKKRYLRDQGTRDPPLTRKKQSRKGGGQNYPQIASNKLRPPPNSGLYQTKCNTAIRMAQGKLQSQEGIEAYSIRKIPADKRGEAIPISLIASRQQRKPKKRLNLLQSLDRELSSRLIAIKATISILIHFIFHNEVNFIFCATLERYRKRNETIFDQQKCSAVQRRRDVIRSSVEIRYHRRYK